MDIFADFATRLSTMLVELYPEADGMEELVARATMEPPRDPSHGDISSNIAMLSAGALGEKPRDIAQKLADRLQSDPDIKSVEVAGPGFLNFRLAGNLWRRVLLAVLTEKENFGRSGIGAGKKVNVEFVSTNPTGPMHVGHTRGAVFGDALASLLQFSNYQVTREYYINDAGAQVDVLARSAFLRYCEALGQEIGEIPAGLYPGTYLVPVGKGLAAEFGDKFVDQPENVWLAVFKQRALEAMMDLIRADLARLGVVHDFFFSETALHGENGKIAQTLLWLRQKGLVYQGTLPPPKGKVPEDWEDREQTLFRATEFGDDTDRPLIKSDGSYTYFAADIAYHRDKYLRGFTDQIIVLGADHSGYSKRLKAAVKAVSQDKAAIDVKICQIVRLMRDGKPFKMSKRSGDLITVADLVNEVGTDAARFMLLFRRNDAMMDFDFARVKEQTRDNPVFYVQYAHARACSVARMAQKDLPDLDISLPALRGANLDLLASEEEFALLGVLAQWPRLVGLAARSHEPHRVAFYLYELAGALHAFWAKGKQDPSLRFVNDKDPKLSLARLALVEGVRQVLALGLKLLGVSAPKELS
ncbi:Arginyl-tRNA synthetase [hydrothermal vent metagenome]|uniref:arginine--tRNA ligase n=1 Tax=hydrothermal vent metagenome TaxID=652676 RepID=A0A3B0TAY4_9ZZZZ